MNETMRSNTSSTESQSRGKAHIHVEGAFESGSVTLQYKDGDSIFRDIVGEVYTTDADAFIEISTASRLRLNLTGATDETTQAQDESDYDGAGDNGSFVAGDGGVGNTTIAAQDETDYNDTGDNGTFTGGLGATTSTAETIDAQDETDYDGAGNNGTFVGGDGGGGTAYVVGEVIGLVEGTIITVDTIDGNDDVATFTVTSNTTKPFDFPSVTVIAQVTSTGSGLGFVLTVDTANVLDTTAYIVADTITLSDGSVITVDAIDVEGDVTQFTVTTNSTGSFDFPTVSSLTQTSTDGVGVGFDLTVDINNVNDTTDYVAAEVLTMSDGGTITVDTVVAGQVTEFTITTNSVTGAGGSGATITQTGTDGSGLGFSITTGDNNVTSPVIFVEIH